MSLSGKTYPVTEFGVSEDRPSPLVLPAGTIDRLLRAEPCPGPGIVTARQLTF